MDERDPEPRWSAPASRKPLRRDTAVHHCRHLPWADYHPGNTVALNLILDQELHSTRLDFRTILHDMHEPKRNNLLGIFPHTD